MKRALTLMKPLARCVRDRYGMVVSHLRRFLASDQKAVLTPDEIEDRFEQLLRCGF